MDERDRQLIFGQMDQLIQQTNYRNLMAQCLKHGILTEVMKEIIEDRYPDEATRHRQLFEKITKRGPTAFQTLLDICNLKFRNAYNLLKTGHTSSLISSQANHRNTHQEEFQSTYNPNRARSISANLGNSNGAQMQQRMRTMSEDDDANNNNDMVETSDNGDKRKRLVEFKGIVQHRNTVKLSAEPQGLNRAVKHYPMIQRNRGVVFIVNIINYINNTHRKRNGAEEDKDNLVSLFRQLGFTVFYYEDLTHHEFVDLITELKESRHLLTECFAFCMLAHGHHTKRCDEIYLNDNSVLTVEYILKLFNNEKCRVLFGKPKMFFFSFCRGEKADQGIQKTTEHTERDGIAKESPTNEATYGDMLICYSTVPGFASHRDPQTGSWFVEVMCKVWAEHAHNVDVEQLMKLVGEEINTYRTDKNALQTVGTETWGFFKALYLNPGYYERDNKDEIFV